MFGLFNDVVLRAEQSRVSYNLQTEEFRNLNANLEIYLGDIKIIDNDNSQLQETIEQVRTKYILTLENHLKRLPNDFRIQSQILTDAHLERYKFKSRTRRVLAEREELKRRINFVSTNEKDQIKYLNHLQKQERSIQNEFNQLNEQYQHVLKYVENEKQIHQQAMNKVDQLQIQREQIYIERSKTEFEIQTLKEEVKLMQTTKEFLDEECQTIISTQTEANEYLLSRLNDSINRIRDDFNHLNKTQLDQIENEYQQNLKTLEENLLANETSNISQQIIPSQYEQLQNEHQSVLQELTTLNNQNQNLSQQVLIMEDQLHSLRNERMEQLISKDNELEYSKIELQTLNEKINHLADYDRNLKFELTLYRGVLESEYKRKQSSNSTAHLIRPTTLRTNKNSNTDRTTRLTSILIQGKSNDQQQQQRQQQEEEEILSTRNRVLSDYDILVDNTNVPINDIISTEAPSNNEKSINEESLLQQSDNISTNITTQETEKLSGSASPTVPTEKESSSRTSSVSTEPRKASTASTPSVSREDQLISSQIPESPNTPFEFQPSAAVASPTQTTLLTNTIPQQYQVLSEAQEASSRTSSISTGTSAEVPKSPSLTTKTILSDELTFSQDYPSPSAPPERQQSSSSRTSSISAGTPYDIQTSSFTGATSTIPEFQPSTPPKAGQSSSRTSTISEKASSDKQDYPFTDVTTIVPEYQLSAFDIQKTLYTPPQEQQSSSRTSSISTATADIQTSSFTGATSTIPEFQPSTSDVRQSPSTLSKEDQPSSRTSTISEKTSSDKQDYFFTDVTTTVPEYQLSTFDTQQPPYTPPQEQQASSRTSSISAANIQTSPFTGSTPTVFEFQQSPSTPPKESQSSSRTSTISEKIPSDKQDYSLLDVTTATPEYQLSTFDIQQSPYTPPQEEEQQPSSRTSSVSAKTSSDTQESPLSSTVPTVLEYQPPVSDARQSSSSTSPQEGQISSRTSSTSAGTSSEAQKSPSSTTDSTIPGYQASPSDIQQSHSLHSEEHQPSSRTSSISTGIEKSPTSSTAPELQSLSTVLSSNQTVFQTGDIPFAFEVLQSSSSLPQEHPTFSEAYEVSSRTSSVSTGISSEAQKFPSSTATPTVPEYQAATFEQEEEQPSSRTSSISAKTASDIQAPPVASTSIFSEYQSSSSDTSQLPATPDQEKQPSSRTSTTSEKLTSDTHKPSFTVETPTTFEYQPPTTDVHELPLTPEHEEQPSSRTSSISAKTSSDIQAPPVASTSIFSEYQLSSSDTSQLPATSEQEQQPSSRTSTTSEKLASDTHESPFTVEIPTTFGYQPPTTDVHESSSTLLEDYHELSDGEESPTKSADVHEKISSITVDDYQITPSIDEFGSANQLNNSLNESDDNLLYEESVSYTADEKATNEVDHKASRESIYSTGPSSVEEFQVSYQTKPNDVRSSSFTLNDPPQEENQQILSQSETNLWSNRDDNQSEFQSDEILTQIKREEDISSSFMNETEENKSTENLSSVINNNLTEFNFSLLQEIIKQSSHTSSLTDIEEVDDPTSQKLEAKSDENENDEDPNLSIIMQDLRFVFHELANDDDLVEIDEELPYKILDRLEFHDNFIQTLFDGLIRKYLVQAANQSIRPQTLDWIEFRDILFPIISGRYTERHVRKLFDLFDTGRDGYLSIQEIAELLEVLHANDTINLAQNIIDDFDMDHDGKLSVDELIEGMKNTENINEHALSEDTENKQWFTLSPTENQIITLEVPNIKFSPKIDEKYSKGISLLGRIFRRVGANFETKQLDIYKKNLSMQLTNEFIHNNINISNDDLQLFIQLFLEKKQKTDSIVNWTEFREIFFPIISNGFYTKNQIRLWFEVFDRNENGMINQEEIIHLLHLLQIQNSEVIIDKLIEITNNHDLWTVDELVFALDSVDETALHLFTNHEQITSFDNDWLSNNI